MERNDSKTVNAISYGAFSKSTKILTATLKFFLGESQNKNENDSDEEIKNKQEVKKIFLT